MLKLSNSAKDKIKEILLEEENSDTKLRVFVQGGGCSGFQYGFTLDDVANEDDFVIEDSGIHVLMDAMSAQYLENAEIDFVEDVTGSSFNIKNPNAQSTCGCGSSFSV